MRGPPIEYAMTEPALRFRALDDGIEDLDRLIAETLGRSIPRLLGPHTDPSGATSR
jgi:hypothetical protein